MLERIHKFLEEYVPEGIPFPGTRSYTLFAKSRFMRDFYRQVASEVAVEFRQGKILDVGTGPGYLPIEIARLAPGVEVIGIDISSDMVKIARRNAEKANLSSRVKFMVEDANKMSFEDSSFDLIVSTGSLHHWKKPLHVINEIYRVLKDGRQAWIYDLRRDVSENVIVKKLGEYKYGKMISLILYNAVKAHSSITLHEVLNMLGDEENRFKQYRIEENRHSYPVLKIRLLKS
jgi:ubiquinone/menaquinone biosynthesis C-methylase UbiE